ncbi:MAG TPA: peptidoglycan-associated lipoprotein Pal [Candidatus Eisenbacteria bacterium]|nr:peptidoglycan-associated lipoprotein Pal [Candidatus Eisenbacteria bacterium]
MVEHCRMLCYLAGAVLSVSLVACAPATAPKPEESTKAGASGPKSGQGAGEGARGGARESDATASGSLDQLREGKPPVTPASSPLKDVFFDFDRYDLRPDARDILKANADWLKKNPSARVEIEGHCDDRGTNEYNLALGAKRSQAVKEYLVTLGIATDRLSTISYGEEIPVCKEPTEECRAKNRRARFVVVPGRPAS